MKKFMQKDLSKAPNFVNRAILRTARVLSQAIRLSSRANARDLDFSLCARNDTAD